MKLVAAQAPIKLISRGVDHVVLKRQQRKRNGKALYFSKQ